MEIKCSKKPRINSFNVLRVIAAVGVLLYHTYWNFGCTYGRFNPVVSQSTFYMTIFFVLGGFVNCYSNYEKHFFDDNFSLWNYIKKRFFALYPTYILIYLSFYYLNRGMTSLKDDIFAFPFQITMLFGAEFYGHIINWGAWFFSLLFMCQIIAPFFIFFVKTIETKKMYIFIALLIILIGFGPFLGVAVYNNFSFRLFEFLIGIILAEIYMRSEKKKFKKEWYGVILSLVLIVMSFVILQFLQIKVQEKGLNHTFFNGFNAFMAAVIVMSLAYCDGKITKIINENLVIKTLANYSLEIWCGTFFSSYIFSRFISTDIVGITRIALAIGITIACGIGLAIYRKLIMKIVVNNEKKFYLITILLVMILMLYKYIEVGYFG